MEFKDKLIAARAKLNLSQEAMARALDVSFATINRWERGKTKEGEFTEKEKKRTSVKEAVGFAYWGVLTAIFFIWGFLGNDGSGIQGNSWISWRYNWIVFAVGGILFPIVMMLCNLIADKDKKD